MTDPATIDARIAAKRERTHAERRARLAAQMADVHIPADAHDAGLDHGSTSRILADGTVITRAIRTTSWRCSATQTHTTRRLAESPERRAARLERESAAARIARAADARAMVQDVRQRMLDLRTADDPCTHSVAGQPLADAESRHRVFLDDLHALATLDAMLDAGIASMKRLGKDAHKRQNKARMRQVRAAETDEQRQARLAKERIRDSARRAAKRAAILAAQ